MPFTLAHPAVVLITPKSQYLHKPALIIGAMSPDFVYFLAGVPNTKFGHTLLGSIICNLPLCFVVYYLYQYLIYPYVWQHLPKLLSLQPHPYPTPHSSRLAFIVFVSCCFIGMATHVALDAFTHKSSTLVQHSQWLQTLIQLDFFPFLNNGLPLYKWFQYGGGVLGLAVIGLYMLIMARRYPSYLLSNWQVSIMDKLTYWGMVTVIALFALLIWQGYQPISVNSHKAVVVMVIRLVDVGFIGLLVAGCIKKLDL